MVFVHGIQHHCIVIGHAPGQCISPIFPGYMIGRHPLIMVISHVWPRGVHKDAIRSHNTLELDCMASFPATVEDLLVECQMGDLVNCSIDESENSLSDLDLFSTIFKN